MKRTLFNTMMGCLAALALAGCGGSGSSSSGPSESLISEGFEGVVIELGVSTSGGTLWDTAVYALVLDSSGQRCTLILPKKEGGTKNPYHKVTGTWSAKSLGNGKFEIWLGYTSDQSECTIHGGTVELTIDNDYMAKYRAGEYALATLDKMPFTHEGNCDYNWKIEQAQRVMIKQSDSLSL